MISGIYQFLVISSLHQDRKKGSLLTTTHFSKTKIDRRMRPVMKRNFLVPESCNSLCLETQRRKPSQLRKLSQLIDVTLSESGKLSRIKKLAYLESSLQSDLSSLSKLIVVTELCFFVEIACQKAIVSLSLA
jgi:hypothetical protein